eukprot:TRINITY_DN15144_c4_g1_i1.p2 TRINITY_DN15144_c4_g1~~TRINITY_DN15144_c4_g1_i1.p2  ORF type:complete len:321 (-),score=104.94 TRINITY_DN15144_c4_g1_i1:507-1469(-)
MLKLCEALLGDALVLDLAVVDDVGESGDAAAVAPDGSGADPRAAAADDADHDDIDDAESDHDVVDDVQIGHDADHDDVDDVAIGHVGGCWNVGVRVGGRGAVKALEDVYWDCDHGCVAHLALSDDAVGVGVDDDGADAVHAVGQNVAVGVAAALAEHDWAVAGVVERKIDALTALENAVDDHVHSFVAVAFAVQVGVAVAFQLRQETGADDVLDAAETAVVVAAVNAAVVTVASGSLIDLSNRRLTANPVASQVQMAYEPTQFHDSDHDPLHLLHSQDHVRSPKEHHRSCHHLLVVLPKLASSHLLKNVAGIERVYDLQK